MHLHEVDNFDLKFLEGRFDEALSGGAIRRQDLGCDKHVLASASQRPA